MKQRLLLITLLLLGLVYTTQAQNRIANLEGINYQAVAIDEDGKAIVGQDIKDKPLYLKEIGVRFTITDGPAGTVTYFQDEHVTTTDKYGMFALTIGLGTQTGNGTYDALLDIPWINGDQWLMVEIAIENDGNYRMVSNEKMQSVPFSFYTDDIADNAITTFKVLDEEIKAEDIDTGAVTTSELLDGTILNEDIADATIDLSTKVTNVLPVVNGGTGTDSLPDAQFLIGGGTGPIRSIGIPGDGQIPVGTTTDPVMKDLVGGTGIIVTQTADSIVITSGVTGINSTSAGNVQVGDPGTGPCGGGRQLLAGDTWVSPSIPLSGVVPGNILVGSINDNLNGCMMSTYVTSNNQIRVAIFNGTGGTQCFISNAELRVLLVQ